MQKPSLQTLFNIAKKKGYSIFTSKGMYNYNLNIWGIRSFDKDTEKYNDLCCIFYESKDGKWSIDYFVITTDPSNILLTKPMNEKGCAILKEGFYKDLWIYGFHKGRRDHKALVQYSPCIVYRDNDKDIVIDSNLPTERGMFGINMHHGSILSSTNRIGLHSAGCQVHESIDSYKNNFIPLIENCVREGNKVFSYALINESDLPIV